MRIVKNAAAAFVALTFVVAAGAPLVAVAQQEKKPEAAAPAPAGKGNSPQLLHYIKYINAIAQARKLEDIFEYVDDKNLELYRAIKPADRLKLLQQMKDQVQARGALTPVSEETEPTKTILVLEGKRPDGKKFTGRVEVVRQAGYYKIAGEEWF